VRGFVDDGRADVLGYFEGRGYGAEAGEGGRATGRGLPERARPTAPEDLTEPLKMSVCGRPVTKGVEDAKRPSFGL
jgi:hypothetical protein